MIKLNSKTGFGFIPMSFLKILQEEQGEIVKKPLHGVVTAVITPFDAKNNVDYKAMEKIVNTDDYAAAEKYQLIANEYCNILRCGANMAYFKAALE